MDEVQEWSDLPHARLDMLVTDAALRTSGDSIEIAAIRKLDKRELVERLAQ